MLTSSARSKSSVSSSSLEEGVHLVKGDASHTVDSQSMNNNEFSDGDDASFSESSETVDFANQRETKQWKRRQISKWIFALVLLSYTVAASVLSAERGEFDMAIPLIVVSCLYLLRRIVVIFKPKIKVIGKPIMNRVSTAFESKKKRRVCNYATFGVFLLFVGAIVAWIVISLNEPYRLVGFVGLIVLYGIGLLCSRHKKRIRTRPILVSFMFMFTVGLLVLRTDVGYEIVAWASDMFSRFLSFVTVGSQFLFGADQVMINPAWSEVVGADGTTVWGIQGSPSGDGKLLEPSTTAANYLHYYAFMVIPTVTYFGAFASLMYHCDLVQPLIKGIGYSFGKALGTTIPESVSAAGNMFLGLTEAPLLIKPFLPDMSTSEIHAVMVGGFSTVSGSIMSAYIGLGVPAGNLISSIVMSSVGSLGMAKLLWPEKKRKDGARAGYVVSSELLNATLYGNKTTSNIIEAIAAGASDTIGLCLNIGAMLIAILSIIAAFNALLDVLCHMINVTGPDGAPVTIELILGYIFAPIVFTMGVTDWSEAKIVGQFIGIKLMATEMTAYISLAEYIQMNQICHENLPTCDLSKTLSERAVLISSYALCGFGNFGSVGIMIGGLAPMAPEKRRIMASSVSHALIAGTLVNLVVATIAGIIEDPERRFT